MKISTKLFATGFVFFTVLLLEACDCQKTNTSQSSASDTLNLIKGSQYTVIDQSPMDISYCPDEFPENKLAGTSMQESPIARVIYSRPHKKGRLIFGSNEKSLCKYGNSWRLGANEATEISFFQPVNIDGKNVGAGRYTMYCIPFEDKWVIVLNSNIDSWGLQIDTSKDLMRFEVPVQKQSPAIEDFTIVFNAATYGSDMLMAWDDVKILLPISYSK